MDGGGDGGKGGVIEKLTVMAKMMVLVMIVFGTMSVMMR